MMQSQSKWALILVLPACLLLAVIGLLPLLAVVNYGFHDIFSLSDVHWVGFDWFVDILRSDRFFASLGRSLLFSALTLAILPGAMAVAWRLGERRLRRWLQACTPSPLAPRWRASAAPGPVTTRC
jgi:glycerol transport system permease protein